MARRVYFITGTDTGVGKTVFAALLTRALRERGGRVAALKPICSGGRGDARRLREAMGKSLSLDEVNPWHFGAPLSPLLAARREQRRVTRQLVVRHLRAMAGRFDEVVVEGAGGLLSPMGEDFDSRDLIVALRAIPVVVGPNRLGAVNQILLVLTALPTSIANQAHVILMNPPRPDLASRTNLELMTEFVSECRVHTLDWLGRTPFRPLLGGRASVRKTLEGVITACS
jgi:dethiobiotin synthetase